MNWFKGLLSRYIHEISWIGLALFFAYMALQAFAFGGRWDLYEPIAIADRLSQGLGYSRGASDGYLTSTTFFPGVSLIAYLLMPFGDWQVGLLHGATIASVGLLFWLLFFVYRDIGGTWPKLTFMMFSVSVSFAFLILWVGYAVEFRPETMALCFYVALFLGMNHLQKGTKRFATISLAVACSVLLMHLLLVPILALMMTKLFSAQSGQEKRNDWIAFFVGITIVGLILFSIDGAIKFALLAHFGRSFMPITESSFQVFAGKIIGFILLWYMAVGHFTVPKGVPQALRKYSFSVPALAWLLTGIASSSYYGGGDGYISAGIVLWMPLFALFAEQMKTPVLALCFFLITLALGQGVFNKKLYSLYQERTAITAEVRERVLEAKAETVIISGDSYLAVRQLGLKQVSEIDAWSHLQRSIFHDEVPIDGDALIERIKPDLIICLQGCKVFDRLYRFHPEKFGFHEVTLDTPTKTQGIYYEKTSEAMEKLTRTRGIKSW